MKIVRRTEYGEIFEAGEEEVVECLTCSLCGKGFSGLEAEGILLSGKCPNCGGSNQNPLTGKN